MKRLMIGVLGGYALWTSPARAQQRAIPLDTVRVEAASSASAELASATRAVEVLPGEALRRLPVATVPEALRWMMGVDLMPRSPALADVSVRGSSFEQVLVLVDGVRVSDAQTGHFDLDLAVPLDQVERVEVLRGAASALHGADAMGGVIHIVTRRGVAATRVRAQGGSHGTGALALSHALAARGVTADLAADLARSDGHRPGTDYQSATARAALSAPLAGETLSADLAWAARDFGADGFYGPFPSYEETRTATAALAWRADPARRFALEPVLSARRHTDDFVLRREDPSFYRNQHETLQWGGELTARYALAPAVRLAAGVEAYQDRLRSRTLGDREEGRAAALAELAAGRVGVLTATAGARLDRYESFGDSWSPSASAAWWPAAGVRLRGSAGRAFRAPTWTERYYRDPANVGDPALDPERAWSAEVGVDAVPRRGVRAGVALWTREARDLIDWAKPQDEPAGPWRTRNVEHATFRGVEAELGSELLGVRWTARGSWLSVQSSAAAGWASKYALRPLVESAGVEVARRFGDADAALLAQRARRSGEDAHLRVDARLALPLGPVRLRLDAQNALGERYLDVTGNPAPGRTLLLGVEWAARSR